MITMNINDGVPFAQIRLIRVTTKNGVYIMYAKHRQNYYGGIRYSSLKDENLIKNYVAQIAFEENRKQRLDEPLRLHKKLKRLIENVGYMLIKDTDYKNEYVQSPCY